MKTFKQYINENRKDNITQLGLYNNTTLDMVNKDPLLKKYIISSLRLKGIEGGVKDNLLEVNDLFEKLIELGNFLGYDVGDDPRKVIKNLYEFYIKNPLGGFSDSSFNNFIKWVEGEIYTELAELN